MENTAYEKLFMGAKSPSTPQHTLSSQIQYRLICSCSSPQYRKVSQGMYPRMPT
jgi:hypothetical protein